MKGIIDTKKYLFSKFKMKKHSGGYSLCQSYYIEKVLFKFDHLKFKEANTPYDSSTKLIKNTGRAITQLEYASVIRSLMYTIHCIRPAIAFAVCKMSRYTCNPSTEHGKAIRRILGYFKRIKGSWFVLL